AGEDLCVIHVEFADDMFAIYDANRYTEPLADGQAFGTFRVEGLGGRLRLEADGRIYVKPLFQDEYEHRYDIPTIGYRGDSCWATQQHFVNCLATGEEFETNGRDYLNTVAAVFACYESAARGAAVAPREIVGQ
ncbi:MAG: gfo/Idh/MocA family oxidoreductase, partial [Armatimonadota bacterium]